MGFLDLRHPFFRPLWLRIATVAACIVWAVVEFVTGQPFWGMLFLGISAYAGWQFFVDWKTPE